MKRIAIISFFHEESSLCLAKGLVENGVAVDYYLITDIIRDVGYQPGIEYKKASKRPGIIKLNINNAPEIVKFYGDKPISLHLLRLLSFSTKVLWLNELIIRRFCSVVKAKNYDVINLVGQFPWIIYIDKGLQGEKLVHTIHEVGSHQDGNSTTPYIEYLINTKAKIIFHSHSTLNRFKQIPNANYCDTAVIPFGEFLTNRLYFSSVQHPNIGLKKNNMTFLFYGYLKPYKGLDMLKETFCRVKEVSNNFALIIAGAGTDPNLDFFKSQSNCKVMNHFLTDEEMLQLNEISDVVLLPYKSASQSGIIPVSFMFGNPVIATNVGAMPEYIKNGENGIIVPKNDANAFADAMLKLLRDDFLSEHLRQGAKKFGHGDKFDWNNIAKETLTFYFN